MIGALALAFLGASAAEAIRAGEINGYVAGATVMPSDEELKALRPQDRARNARGAAGIRAGRERVQGRVPARAGPHQAKG